MLAKNSAKTKSAPKYRTLGVLGFLAALLLIAKFSFLSPQLVIGSKSYNFEVVTKPEDRKKGLSGRSSLPEDKVMLFDFDGMGRHCIWMKDMKFSIDIIWLSSEKHVRHIEENVAPETYPTTFCPPGEDISYVIETAVGQVKISGVKLGDSINF